MAIKLQSLPDEEFVAPGRAGCAGCPAVMGARMANKVLGRRAIMVNSTGCMCVNYGYQGAPRFPYIHSLFPNAGAIAAGIDAGLTALGKREGIHLYAYCGDGGTVDIGLQALSGAVDRGHRFLYICYDNEGYMNTGVQRSGSTPYRARTTTTPVGKRQAGERRPLSRRKDMVRIMAAHGIPYAATASVAYPLDYMKKVEKAIQIKGPTYIHLHAPCLVGWGISEDAGVKVARLAVETGLFPLYEVADGQQFRWTRPVKKRKPLETYIRPQGRFKHLTDEDIRVMQTEVDRQWEYLDRLCGL